MSTFIQVASDVDGPQYTGEATGLTLFHGQHATRAQTLANTQTLEIGLLTIPKGTIVTAIQWAISGALISANAAATFGIRKRASNGYSFTPNGPVAGAVDGAVQAVHTAGIFGNQAIAAAILDDASGANGIATLQPGRWKIGVEPGGQFQTQEDLIISLLVAATGVSNVAAGVNVFLGVHGVYRGH